MTQKTETTSSADEGQPRRFVPNFIIDEPAKADELNGRQRLASTIADTLIGNQDIKFVGILGEWGSGKSSVVHLLERKLDESSDPQILCFNYDAWLHQSDPPKRSFLEALVRFVREDKRLKDVNLDTATWDDNLKELNRQVETSEVFTRPQLATSAKVILPAVVFIPLGVKLLGDGVLSQAALRDPWAVALFAAGWALALGPAILATLIYLHWRPWKEPGVKVLSRAFWFRHRKAHEDDAILAVFANKPTEFKFEQKSKGPEPSTIEFQDMFRKIVAAVQTKKRRLVIVIDNLDRIPNADRLALWSTIRSFFLGSDHAGRALPRRELPAVVLPIDTDALDRLSGMDNAGQAFSDKTFDLVFNVPPPVLSKWQDYMRARLREVFGDQLRPRWLDSILRVYEASALRDGARVGASSRITPRSINVFVNTIASYWMQWRTDGVPLETIAYFVLARIYETHDIYSVIQECEAIESYDSIWESHLVAMYYGLPVKMSEELFMKDIIVDSISKLDKDKFVEISKMPAFDHYFVKAIVGEDFSEGNIDPMATAMMISGLLIDRDGSGWVSDVWWKIRAAVPLRVEIFNIDLTHLDVIFDNSSKENSVWLLQKIAESVSKIKKEATSGKLGQLIDLIQFIKSISSELKYPIPVMLIDGVSNSIVMLEDDEFESLQGVLEFRSSSREIVDFLVDRVRMTVPLLQWEVIIRNLLSLRADVKLGPLWLDVVDSMGVAKPNEIGQVIEVWWSLAKLDPHSAEIALPLARDASLAAGLLELLNRGEHELLSKGVALAISISSPLPPFAWDTLFAVDPELGARVGEHLLELDYVGAASFRTYRAEWSQAAPLLKQAFASWSSRRSFSDDERVEIRSSRGAYDRLLDRDARAEFWARVDPEANAT